MLDKNVNLACFIACFESDRFVIQFRLHTTYHIMYWGASRVKFTIEFEELLFLLICFGTVNVVM